MLREGSTPADVGEHGSNAAAAVIAEDAADSDQENEAGESGIVQAAGDQPRGTPFWSDSEFKCRREVPSIWLELANADCFRKVFLQYLGQWKLPLQLRMMVDKETCCNACNSSLVGDMPAAPVEDIVKLRKPSDGSMAGVALGLIDQWAVTKANLK
jgi:hypothetical protein